MNQSIMQTILISCGVLVVCNAGSQKGPSEGSSADTREVRGSQPPPRALRGHAFSPKIEKLPADLADWAEAGKLADDSIIKKVRIYGFDQYNDGKPLDIVVTDQVVLTTCAWALGALARPAMSEFDPSTGGIGQGAHLGVIQIVGKDRTLVIGVSQKCFFMGIWHGSFRQSFFSWILAKQVDDLLFRATNQHLTKKQFDALSGLSWIEHNRHLFYSVRKRAK